MKRGIKTTKIGAYSDYNEAYAKKNEFQKQGYLAEILSCKNKGGEYVYTIKKSTQIYIDYKKLCLEINPKLKVYKQSPTINQYRIIQGNKNCHTVYSSAKNTIALAWEDCYKYLSTKN